MTKLLMIGVTVAYLGITLDCVFKRNYGLALTYFGYALANVGLLAYA